MKTLVLVLSGWVLALSAPAAPVEVAINPASIHVIGVRERDVAWALSDGSKPCKPEV